MPDLDDNGTGNVATDDVVGALTTNVKKEGSLETTEPNTIVSKLELTQEELDAIKAEAVAQAKQEQEERIRKEEAERQGNYKILFEQAEEEKKLANLELWREKALNKYKLSEDLLYALVGETEEELMKAAKKLRTNIDKEVENRLRAETAPPPDPGRVTPPRQRTANVDETVKRRISTALNIGRVLH